MLQSAYEAAPEIDKQIPVEMLRALLSWLNLQVEGQRTTMRIDGLEKTSANLKLLAVVVQTTAEMTRRHSNQERFKKILLGICTTTTTSTACSPPR